MSNTTRAHAFPAVYLLPLRLWIGAAFMIAGWRKISEGNWGAAYETSLHEFVTANLENAFDFYRPILESFVLPNTATFAVLVSWGELLVGVSIFLGLFTRFGAAIGIFLVLNYTFTAGHGIWMPGLDSAYIWALFTLFACSAGRGMGADQLLRSSKKIRLFT